MTKLIYGVWAVRGYSSLMIRGGTALAGVSIFFLVSAHNPLILLVFSVLYGCGAASVWPAALSHFGGCGADDRAQSMAHAFAPWMAGSGVGMLLTNVLIHYRPHVYWGLPIAACLVFLGTWLLNPVVQAASPTFRREWQLVQVLSRHIKGFLPPMILQTLMIGTITPFLSLFGVRSLHLHPSQNAFLLVGIGAITFLVLLPFGKVSDRVGRLPILTCASLTSAVSIFVLGSSHTWGQALVAGTFFAAGFGAVFPAWNALFLDKVPRALRTRAVGVFTAVEDSGTVFGPFIGALAWQIIGSSGPFWVAGVILSFLGVYFAVWWRRSHVRSVARPFEVK